MLSGFDIHKIQWDGYLILPLSMNRLAKWQTPEFCYEILERFIWKLETYSNDVIFLYTNGLYFNSEEISFENRKKTTQQSLNHIYALRNLIEKRKDFIPNAIHYLPIDYIIFNSPYFKDFFDKLKFAEQTDDAFKKTLLQDIKNGQKYTEANINFLMEEIVVNHIIREGFIDLPQTLVRNNTWRLIAYPWKPLQSDIYQWIHSILPKWKDRNPFKSAHYNLSTNHIILFEESAPKN